MYKNTLTNFFTPDIFYTYYGGDENEFHQSEGAETKFGDITPLFRIGTGGFGGSEVTRGKYREERESKL